MLWYLRVVFGCLRSHFILRRRITQVVFVLAHDGRAFRLRQAHVLSGQEIDVTSLLRERHGVFWCAEMDEIDGISCRVADSNNARLGVVSQATYAISVVFMRKTKLLNGLPETQIPELKNMVLLESNEHVAKCGTFRDGTILVEKHDRRN